MLLLWFFTACLLCRYIFGKGWLSFAAVGLMILHPYFIWTCLIAPDTASECFFLFLSFLVLLKLHEHFPVTTAGKTMAGILCLAVPASAALMRTTSFVILLLLLFFLLLKSRKETRNFIAVMLIVFTAYTAVFCFYNYQRKGAFTLSTTFGFNMFIGNCKAYLHGHPKYDIDLFFTRQWLKQHEQAMKGLSEAQQNRYYINEGISEIRRDIPAFVYRCIVKSLWHWFNIEKIPNFAAPETYLSRDGSSIAVGSIVIIPALAYVTYKLFYIPLFIAAIGLVLLKRISFRYAIFFIPYLALWPLVVVMFPDTRFKISAEIMAIIPIVYGLSCLSRYTICLRNDAAPLDQDEKVRYRTKEL